MVDKSDRHPASAARRLIVIRMVARSAPVRTLAAPQRIEILTDDRRVRRPVLEARLLIVIPMVARSVRLRTLAVPRRIVIRTDDKRVRLQPLVAHQDPFADPPLRVLMPARCVLALYHNPTRQF